MIIEPTADTIEEMDPGIEAPETVNASDAPNGTDGSEGDAGAPGPEEIPSFDEDSPPLETSTEEAPQWVKDLRKDHREAQRKLREYEARERARETEEKPLALPTKPTLEEADYDEEKFAANMERYFSAKSAHDAKQKEAQAEAERENQEWNSRLKHYATERATIKPEDFEESEFAVQKSLSQIQQWIIIKATGRPAKMMLALGKSPKKLAELAAITDPVRFAVEIGKLESKMGSTSPSGKAPIPQPERILSGNAPRTGSDAKLEALRKEAERTGNYSKVLDYKRSLRK